MGASSGSAGTPFAIRGASEALRSRLLGALREERELAQRFADEDSLTLASPAEIGTASLALFLYRVAPDARVRNLPSPGSRGEGTRAYELDYLVVPFAASAAEDQLILESCLRALDAEPGIGGAGGGFEGRASVADLSLEELTRLWRALGEPYRLSIGLRVRLVDHGEALGPTTIEHAAPGVYVEEIPAGLEPIQGVDTSTAGFAGAAERGPLGCAQPIASFAELEAIFGGPLGASCGAERHLALAVRGFFENGGRRAYVARAAAADGGKPAPADVAAAIDVLAQVDGIAILAAPGQADPLVHDALLEACARRKRFAILDPAPGSHVGGGGAQDVLEQRRRLDSPSGALYFPWLRVADLGKGGDPSGVLAPPSGHVAGIYARVDRERGVHAAPANEVVAGALGLELSVGNREQELLNPAGVNAIRDLRAEGRGVRVRGSRTLSGAPEWKYVNVRRLALFVERSLESGLHWVIFEPNAEPLWARMASVAEDFLLSLWRSGSLVGSKPDEASFVRIDRSTMTQSDIDAGRLTMLIGFAPLKPAEFVVLRLEWMVRAAG